MPKRNAAALREYKKCCKAVWERAGGVCEILVDGERCKMQIPFDQCRYINFAHKETRNGKSQEWVNDPASIFFSCALHHLEEERTGVRMQGVEYEEGEPTYIPDEN